MVNNNKTCPVLSVKDEDFKKAKEMLKTFSNELSLLDF